MIFACKRTRGLKIRRSNKKPGQTASPRLQNGLTHYTCKEELIVYHEHHDKKRARNKNPLIYMTIISGINI